MAEPDTEPVGLAVQPRAVGVQLLQRRELLVTGGDPAQPGVGHRRVDLGGLTKPPEGAGLVGVERRHGLIEPLAGGGRGIAAGHFLFH